MSFRGTMMAAAILAAGLAGSLTGYPGGAWAQQNTTRIWDIPFGTSVKDLPAHAFLDPACGTNGGPPGHVLESFEQFAECPADADTGLREVWFIYDDTLEYVGLARRDPAIFKATVVLGQPVILSFLIGDDGRVAGYRIFTDSRADTVVREEAHALSIPFRARLGMSGWQCADLPRGEGEKDYRGVYVKERCEKDSGGRFATVESRLYLKEGQSRVNPFNNRPTVNEFESWARVEVVQMEPLGAAELARLDAAAAAANEAGPPQSDPRAAFLAEQAGDCPGCDLAGADLRRRDLTGADLSGANLREALLHRAILRNADLSGADLSAANLNRADLTFADLRNANLSHAMLWQADAARADFSGANLYFVYMGRARLTLAVLAGASLLFADLGEAQMNDVVLIDAILDDAYLYQTVLFRADMRGVVANRATLTEAHLRNANLAGADLRNADLVHADLAGADLAGADFRNAQLLSAILIDTNREGTLFAGAQMPDNSVGR